MNTTTLTAIFWWLVHLHLTAEAVQFGSAFIALGAIAAACMAVTYTIRRICRD